MLLLNNIILISKRFSLLLIFLTTYLNASSYESIYNINEAKVKYQLENNNYKVLLSNENMIDYQSSDGFKLYLPNFVKEYNLALLRFNSIGEINGHLSNSKNFRRKHIIYPQANDLQYLITNYKNKNQRQLSYLLNKKTINFSKQTDLSFEAYSIPKIVNYKLNKWFYFTFDKSNINNKLQYLVYSYYMILDKKEVDKFVSKNYKIKTYHQNHEFNKIHTYMQNLTNSRNKTINYKKKSNNKNTITKNKTNKNSKKIKTKKVVRLNLKRFLYMKDFGYILDKSNKNTIDYSKVKELLLPLENNDNLLLEEYKSKLNSVVNKLALYEELFNIQNRKNDEFKEILRIKIELNDELFNLNKEGFTDSIANIFDDEKYNKLKNILDNFENIINNHTYKNDYMNNSMKRKYKNEIKELESIVSSFEFNTNNLANKNNHKEIEEELEKIKQQDSNNCDESDKKLNTKCLNNPIYVNNFIYKSLKNNNTDILKDIAKYTSIRSQNDIAKYYFEIGENEKALQYLQKAYKKAKGEVKKQIAYNLGVFYATRNGLQDNKKSIIYFKESKNKEANFNIAINYYIGLGVKENNKLAYKYFSKSAKQGLLRAQANKKLMKQYK